MGRPSGFTEASWSFTHKVLLVVICKEVLQAAGPVRAALQQAEHALLTAHVAVPRVLLDGGVGGSLTHQEVHALHTEAPGHGGRRRVSAKSAKSTLCHNISDLQGFKTCLVMSCFLYCCTKILKVKVI